MTNLSVRVWRLAGTTVLTLTLLLSAALLAVAETLDPPRPDWVDSGIDTVAVIPIPGSDNQYVPDPSTGTEDPYIYEPRSACTDGDSNIFPACAAVMPSCAAGTGSTDGTPGNAIYWYRAVKTAVPPVWTYYSGPECVYGEKPRDLLAEIASQIASEFQRTPVAGATIGSQPGPHTLRGKETNVFAEATIQTFNITLLGQQVTITATPVAYTWDYGDGTVWGPTPVHGAPLHKERIGEQTQTSHIYTETGRLAINLTTHFDGSYTVNGGPSLPIPGQGNIASPALGLTVWRAETNLYADNCFQNPQGVGC